MNKRLWNKVTNKTWKELEKLGASRIMTKDAFRSCIRDNCTISWHLEVLKDYFENRIDYKRTPKELLRQLDCIDFLKQSIRAGGGKLK